MWNSFGIICAAFAVGCSATVDTRGTLDDCGPLERQAAEVWCDRTHPFAAYCRASPQPEYCIAVHESEDGTGDALYCCDPAGLR